MVQSTITDADMDDTLTWSAASDMEMYATATVDNMGMVTITGVAAGMATITVTAMDAAGESTMQTIMVTVEAAEFTAPTSVAATSASGTITINWMPGDLAASQVIIAVNVTDDTDYCLHIDTSGTLAMHECPRLTTGQTYVVLVIALDAQDNYMLGNVETHVAQ